MDFLPPPTVNEDSVRVLTPEEILSYVKPHYDATGNPLPDPAISTFVGVIRSGKVVAALGLQLKLHAQPLMVDEGQAAVLPALIHGAEQHILRQCGPQWTYLFVPDGRLAELAEAFEMTREPWVVMSKLVMPAAPPKPVDAMPLQATQEDINVVRPQ